MKYSENKFTVYLSLKAFKKTQNEVWNQPPCFSFCMIVEEKYFSRNCIVILLTDRFRCLIAFSSFFPDCISLLCIVIICWPVCDIINFETNHSFFIKASLHIAKKSGQKCSKRAFNVKYKEFFLHIFKAFSVVRNCLRPGSGPLRYIMTLKASTRSEKCKKKKKM